MKKFLIGFFTVIIGLSLTIGSYAQEKEKSDNSNQPVKEVQKNVDTNSNIQVKEGTPVNTICPVSKEDADPKVTYNYNGKTYAFCCNKCLKKFKADPEKYIKRMNEDEKPVEKAKDESKQ
jgi:YHS domain-containing protein